MEVTNTYQRIITTNVYYDYALIGQLRTYAKYTSQDKVNNITYYSLKQTLYYSGSGTFNFGTTTSRLDGTTKSYNSVRCSTGYEITLSEVSRNIQHNSDGSSPTKSVSSSFSAKEGIGATGSANITFPRIDRYAYITGTLSSATDESEFYIDYNNPLGLDMSVWLEVNPVSAHYCERTIGNATSGRYTWVLSQSDREALQNAMPNSSTGTIRIGLLSTLNGTNGASYKDVPFTITSVPNFDVAYQDTNATTLAITNNNQQLIQNHSTLQINITNAEALKGASLSTISVTINNQTTTQSISSSTLNINMGTLNLSSNTQATITVKDTRNSTRTKTLDLTVLQWESPTALITLNRKQNYYTETDIKVDANYSSLDSKNVITIQYRYKKTSDGSYGSWYSLSDNVTSSFNIDNRYAWNVQVKVNDLLGTITYDNYVGIGTPVFFIDRIKRSISVNNFPKYNNSVEVNGVDISNTDDFTERPIGRWNGLIKYRKTINTGAISSTQKSVAHNISNLDWVTDIYGIAKSSAGNFYSLPRVSHNDVNTQIGLQVTSTNVVLDVGNNANFADSYVTIEYTKSV